MNIFIDTEFNGYKGELISIGLKADDGREFYEVFRWDTFSSPIDPWVMENVVPKLGKRAMPRETILEDLCQFLSGFDDITFVADWPEDITHLLNLFVIGPGKRVGPDKYKIEINNEISSEDSAILHHALHDAIAIRESYLDLPPPPEQETKP